MNKLIYPARVERTPGEGVGVTTEADELNLTVPLKRGRAFLVLSRRES